MKKAFVCMMILTSLLLSSLQATAEENKNTENLALGKPYTIEADIPNGRSYAEFDDDDGVRLTDGKKGAAKWSDPAYSKFYRSVGRTVRIDLGENCEIDRVTARFITDHDAGVFRPDLLTVFVSADGKNYSQADILSGSEAPFSTSEIRPCGIVTYDMPVKPVCGRYVAVHFDVTVNTFSDEIEVFGKKGTSLTPPTEYTDIIPPAKGQYADRESLGGDHDIILFHAGYYPQDETLANNTKETFLPFIAHLDRNGKIDDTMFDSVMFLILQGKCPSDGGLNISGGPTILSDWLYLLDQYFSDTYNLRALNEAAKEVKEALGKEDYKVPVYLTCPYPKISDLEFGDYNKDSKSEKISTYDDCLSVSEWFVDECITRFAENGYENLVFKGFFFNSEGITGQNFPYEMQYAKDFCGMLHERNLLCVMIPYFSGKGIECHEDIGFDTVLMQPNVSFDKGLQDDPAGAMADFNEIAQQLGLGIEMEVDSKIIWEYEPCASYYTEYLRSASNCGLMKDTLHAYYNGAGLGVFGRGATSEYKNLRWLYDMTYKFIKGTLALPDDPFTGECTSEICVKPKQTADGFTGCVGDWQNKITITKRPEHGYVTFSEDGKTFSYLAKDNIGEDSFTYEIKANGATVSRTVKCSITDGTVSSDAESVPAESVNEPGKEDKKGGFPIWIAAVGAAVAAAAAGIVLFFRKKKKQAD